MKLMELYFAVCLAFGVALGFVLDAYDVHGPAFWVCCLGLNFAWCFGLFVLWPKRKGN